ncbi:MAG: NAD-dependent epimerase/dehydratase family protein [Vicinamibacteria bacterium]
MSALVTGVAGFIGSHLAEALVGRGEDVIGVDSFLDYYPRELKEANLSSLTGSPRFTLIEAPIQEMDLAPLLKKVRVVYHLAAQAGVRASWGRDFSIYTDNNILATQRLLEAAIHSPPDAFVYASSSSVYGDVKELPMTESIPLRPVSPYGVSKLAVENLCYLYSTNHRLPTVGLRYFTVYGPRQRPDMAFHRLFGAARDGEEFHVYGDGLQTRDFTYVSDAVEATLAAAKDAPRGSVYNVGGGARVSLLDVIREIEDITGSKLRLRREPSQKGDMRDTYADTTAARRDLGYRPRVTLREGLEAEWAWLTGKARRGL